jgi:hypothetical protein
MLIYIYIYRHTDEPIQGMSDITGRQQSYDNCQSYKQALRLRKIKKKMHGFLN